MTPGLKFSTTTSALRGQLSDDFDAARILQIDGDASLVAMEIGRVVEHPLLRLPAGPLHTKYGCAKIGKYLRAGGAGSNRREIHD